MPFSNSYDVVGRCSRRVVVCPLQVVDVAGLSGSDDDVDGTQCMEHDWEHTQLD